MVKKRNILAFLFMVNFMLCQCQWFQLTAIMHRADLIGLWLSFFPYDISTLSHIHTYKSTAFLTHSCIHVCVCDKRRLTLLFIQQQQQQQRCTSGYTHCVSAHIFVSSPLQVSFQFFFTQLTSFQFYLWPVILWNIHKCKCTKPQCQTQQLSCFKNDKFHTKNI